MAANDREARRRRIVERGSDRFALITGRSQNLSATNIPSPTSPYGHHERALSCPPMEQHPKPKFGRSTLTHVSRFGDEKAVGFLLPGLNAISDADKEGDNAGPDASAGAGAGESTTQPVLGKFEIVSEVSSAPPALEPSSKVEPSSANRNSSVTSTGSDQHLETHKWTQRQTNNHGVSPPNQIISAFTRSQIIPAINSNQIIFAVQATEQNRLHCSVAVAIVVVLSHLGFPILGCYIIKSIISLMPLYIVLLTNLTFVITQFLSIEETHIERIVKGIDKFPSDDRCAWADQVGDALQAGMLITRVGLAVFTDVGVYAAIVTCGLCFT